MTNGSENLQNTTRGRQEEFNRIKQIAVNIGRNIHNITNRRNMDRPQGRNWKRNEENLHFPKLK
jgi:hypothetical protein